MNKGQYFSNSTLKKVFILLVITLSCLGIYDLIFSNHDNFNNKTSESNRDSRVKITSIDFFSHDSQERIGIIVIKDNDVVFEDCSQKNECEILQKYIDQNRQDWLTRGITYPVGGCDKNSCWDGTETSFINDPNFINGLLSVFDENFSDQYSISVTKEEI